jgi:chromosome partitioning protein
MKVAVVFSQKGGSGKSTLSIHVAVEASRAGRKVALIDADPQGTAAAWAGTRDKSAPTVVRGDALNIRDLIEAASNDGFDLVVIDCPPHIGVGASELVATADVVVVPVQASFPDMAALQSALTVIQAAGKPFVFVVNRAGVRSPETREAVAMLSPIAPVCPTVIHDRAPYRRALSSGLAVSEFTSHKHTANQETSALFRWLESRM